MAKCVAGRQRDWDFAKVALSAGIAELDPLLELVGDLPVGQTQKDRVRSILKRIQKQIDTSPPGDLLPR